MCVLVGLGKGVGGVGGEMVYACGVRGVGGGEVWRWDVDDGVWEVCVVDRF